MLTLYCDSQGPNFYFIVIVGVFCCSYFRCACRTISWHGKIVMYSHYQLDFQHLSEWNQLRLVPTCILLLRQSVVLTIANRCILSSLISG